MSVNKREIDQANLDQLLAYVVVQHPTARQVHLATSDTNGYGFTLTRITLADGKTIDDTGLDDAAWNFLCDVDWGGVVGEDQFGYATLVVPDAT